MSWLDKLTGGFRKTADRLGDNIGGSERARRLHSTPRPSTISRKR
jgi:fused signal recognition particle receptor